MQDITLGFSAADLSQLAWSLGINLQRMWAAGARAPAILYALKHLQAHCDGARTRDGKGFSRYWTRWGHWLASQQALTSLQAAIGQYIVHRHRRQIPPQLLAAAVGDLRLAALKRGPSK